MKNENLYIFLINQIVSFPAIIQDRPRPQRSLIFTGGMPFLSANQQ